MASTTSNPQVDSKLVRELADILNDTELTEIEVEKGELRIRVAREITAAPAVYSAQPMHAPMPAPAAAPAPAPATAPETPAATGAADAKSHPGAVTSPMVGTVYLRPSPEADQFKKAGDSVKEGETILLVEAMKTFNPITAPKSGTLTELLVDDAQPVEYGEALFIIS
ncbi:MAG: acetyl-CoA carboxylase, biotin carboxyl carrier protein [Oceanicaulis sp.]|jgi:acetyl-CoA carboxylase biotin carboxyl carrier protein|uniref:acetyl-CoA carboxylase biotin carboxyl carrier protein n=1 Tax=unclassified Oceanicaulis TaxID=2632123 RepID=UPI000066D5BE|nr:MULTISPECIES: acetyl-CoA carboxylase biotin carboxyl carrier protein [unclassified Oceanicaulis]EAP91176.1 acetyl-CoA carboxylase, biotin carboxyl carrier protein [Oceanicaulis sp. HTCC2633]MAB70230.1 acetyl-CoA carboxylase, biotin carboxyl carrier protein [Oceanicaulis sp.]MBC39203.1 acetyl-CoA carboxylase, biotin carboxyl carrier protein [Oceanicaulis sp.]MBG37276.1 acetyl-CoA carboxylase, biotin carboxyl carrier protein [Oceanicaulis sp.]HBU61596.1 acetyl-CoA carboxylase biotin carboxyl |tara:strand:+ start:165 stop:668 length:504 start_codon:yes stop_codon:yes gene_type:complete